MVGVFASCNQLCIEIAAEAKEPLGLAFIGRGFDVRVGVPFDRSMAEALGRVARQCVEACPTAAMNRDETGIVSIDQGKCMGCGYCEWACPYSAPQYQAGSGQMSKCDFCRDELKTGNAPACVAACPTGAMQKRPKDGIVFATSKYRELLHSNPAYRGFLRTLFATHYHELTELEDRLDDKF